MDTIVVLDFGSQTTQLIGRRIRDLGVYSEVLPGTEPIPESIRPNVAGVILSGSPASVHEPDAPKVDRSVLSLEVPVLGICFGLQQLIERAGGSVARASRREYGRAPLRFRNNGGAHPLFRGVSDNFLSWMSHGDSLSSLPDSFEVLAESHTGVPAAVRSVSERVLGIQFHPEVTHCEYGNRILENFVVGICGASRDWSMDHYVGQARKEIRDAVGNRSVLTLISGGVDSTVTGALLLDALDPEQVHLMYIDTGLMRKGETDEVRHSLEELGATHLHIIDARERFLSALSNVADPERKREIIGDLFMTVQQEELAAREIGEDLLAQGTLYTDLIESGKGIGSHAQVIKSHHNVRAPLVAEKREAGLIIEPLSKLYKDEVRQLGRVLGLPETVVGRHPFPGPGLAVRIVGEITAERIRILQDADAIYTDELRSRGLYDKIWQAFAVLLPVRSVGVVGDTRAYGSVVALRAVSSADGMTADVYPMETRDLLEISARITNEVSEVGRVVYDVSSKPPATIEWE